MMVQNDWVRGVATRNVEVRIERVLIALAQIVVAEAARNAVLNAVQVSARNAAPTEASHVQ